MELCNKSVGLRPSGRRVLLSYFLGSECLDLNLTGFPKGWTSPSADKYAMAIMRKDHLPSWENIKEWLQNPASSEKFFKRWAGFRNINKKHKQRKEEEEEEWNKQFILPEAEDKSKNKYRSLILEKGKTRPLTRHNKLRPSGRVSTHIQFFVLTTFFFYYNDSNLKNTPTKETQ